MIQEKLENLFEAINQIAPVNELISHCCDGNSPYVEDLLRVLDALINKASVEKENYIKEIESLESNIILYSEQLNLPSIDIPDFENLGLRREFLKNEHAKITDSRNKVAEEIRLLIKSINELSRELNCNEETPNKDQNFVICHTDNNQSQNISNENQMSNETFKNYKIDHLFENISIKALEALKAEKQILQLKIKHLEAERQSFYDVITDLNKKLNKKTEFTYSENICELRKQMEQLKKEFQKRKNDFEGILEEIKKRERLLNLENRIIEYSLDTSSIENALKYNNFLINEQNRLFDEIYERTSKQLIEIYNVLGKESIDYPKTEDSLVEMRRQLDKYENAKEKHDDIVEFLKKRKGLLIRMTEFEVLASDPRRLFKSSFQLNTEEKFRNSAYPSLLKIEEALFDRIDFFEESYGPFVHDGIPYKAILKHEIDNRIINRTVFISRCDSPFRKKK